MTDMAYYNAHTASPDYGFSPDAEYPVINIEKGGLHILLSQNTGGEEGAEIPVYELYAGERPNVVPGIARAVVGCEDASALRARLELVAASRGFELDLRDLGNGRAEITATGKSAHASTPHLGKNAAGMLLIALSELGAGGGSREAIQTLAACLGISGQGKLLGIAVMDELSGPLTCNLGILRYDGEHLSAHLDIRYPLCASEEKICGQICMKVSPAQIAVTRLSGHAPHHVPADHKVVKGLLKAYSDVTGHEATPSPSAAAPIRAACPTPWPSAPASRRCGHLPHAGRVVLFGKHDAEHPHRRLAIARNWREGGLTCKMCFSIAIDGPSGAGKSSVARAVAEKLDAMYLDTGAMYRAVGLYMLKNGVPLDDPAAIAAHCMDVDVRVGYGKDGQQCVYLGEEDVSEAIRAAEVRWRPVGVHRAGGARAHGRPGAASPRPGTAWSWTATSAPRCCQTPRSSLSHRIRRGARARRRFEELARKGMPEPYDKVLEELIRRDEIDIHRAARPCARPRDAVESIARDMTLEWVAFRKFRARPQQVWRRKREDLAL